MAKSRIHESLARWTGLCLLGAMAGCGQDNVRLAENAAVQGRAGSEATLQTENANLARRAGEMEADLAARHRFYQSLKGRFEGDLQTEQGQFKVRLTLAPSLAPFPVGRVRTLEEIAADLNNLYLNVQVVQWNPADRTSAVGCRLERVRPDILQGQVTMASEACPNVYLLQVGRNPDENQAIASDVLNGKINQVSVIRGLVQPSGNAAIYEFAVNRIGSERK